MANFYWGLTISKVKLEIERLILVVVVSLSFDYLVTSPWITRPRVASNKLFSFIFLFYEYTGYHINTYEGNYLGMLQEFVCYITVSNVVNGK